MQRTISTQEIQDRFPEALRAVLGEGDRFVIEHEGRPVAALIPVPEDREEESIEAELLRLWLEIRENADLMDDDEAMKLAVEEVRAVRSARPHYLEEQQRPRQINGNAVAFRSPRSGPWVKLWRGRALKAPPSEA